MQGVKNGVNREQTRRKRVLICAGTVCYVLLGDLGRIVASPVLKLNFVQAAKAGQRSSVIEEKMKGKRVASSKYTRFSYYYCS